MFGGIIKVIIKWSSFELCILKTKSFALKFENFRRWFESKRNYGGRNSIYENGCNEKKQAIIKNRIKRLKYPWYYGKWRTNFWLVDGFLKNKKSKWKTIIRIWG